MRVLYTVLFSLMISTSASAQDAGLKIAILSYQDTIAQETMKFNLALENLRTKAVLQIEEIAKKAFSEGDAKLAAEAWKQVLILDNSNRKARDFFETFGKLEDVLREIDSNPKETRRTSWAFKATKEKPERFVKFAKLPNGKWQEFDMEGNETFLFTEKIANSDFIELIDENRKVLVRLHHEIYYVKTPFHSGELWEASNQSGNWIK